MSEIVRNKRLQAGQEQQHGDDSKRSEKDNEVASNESFNERRKNVLISKEMALNCLSIFLAKETKL